MPLLDANGNPITFDVMGECSSCQEQRELVIVGIRWLCEECAAPVIAARLKAAARREEI